MRRTAVTEACALGLVVLALTSCTPPAGEPVARVGSEIVTREMLARELEGVPAYARASFEGPDGERKLLEKMIEHELLYLEALDRGLDAEPSVREKLEQTRRKVLMGEIYHREVQQKVGIPDEEVERYYAEHRGEFSVPGVLDVYHLVVATSEEAEDLARRVRGGEDFGVLAGKFSLDRGTRAFDGRVGAYEKGQAVGLPSRVEAVLDTLQPGDVSDPIEGEGGFHLVMLREAGPTSYKSIEEVAPLIRNRLLVTEEDVARYYEEHLQDYYLPEQLALRHVAVKSRDEAVHLRERVLQGESVEDIAKRHSIDPQLARRGGLIRSYRRGGTIPWLGRDAAFEQAAFSTPVGELSGVFETEKGYHFLQVESKQEGRQQTLEEVEARIRPRLVAEAREEAGDRFYKRLRQKFGVEIFLALQGKSAEDVFAEARQVRDPDKKIEIYRQIVKSFPQHPRAEDSQFMIGFLQAEELELPEEAVRTLGELLTRYPQSHWCDDARAMIDDLRAHTDMPP